MTVQSFWIGEVAVAPLAVGTMYFGTQVPRDRATACLDAAFEVGARFWDTANNYAFWAGGVGDESETTIGAWLSKHGSATREQVVIASKVGARPRTVGAGLDEVEGLSPTAIRAQVDGSLARLRTGHIDVLYAHVDDPTVPFEETLDAFAALVRDGKVRTIAASNLTGDRLLESLAAPTDVSYRALQQRFTYLQPRPGADLGPHVLLDDPVQDICMSNGLTMLGYSPLLSGAYDRADRDFPEGYEPNPLEMRCLWEAAHQLDLAIGQTVLSWMVHREQPVIPVVGVSRPEHVTSAWQAVTIPMPPEQARALDDARRG